jgi:hypothetical protein
MLDGGRVLRGNQAENTALCHEVKRRSGSGEPLSAKPVLVTGHTSEQMGSCAWGGSLHRGP